MTHAQMPVLASPLRVCDYWTGPTHNPTTGQPYSTWSDFIKFNGMDFWALTRHLPEPARHELAERLYPLMVAGVPAKALLLGEGVIQMKLA